MAKINIHIANEHVDTIAEQATEYSKPEYDQKHVRSVGDLLYSVERSVTSPVAQMELDSIFECVFHAFKEFLSFLVFAGIQNEDILLLEHFYILSIILIEIRSGQVYIFSDIYTLDINL